MSITLSLLDLFTYFIPGMVYLYTINEYLALFKITDIEYSRLLSSPYIFISILIAYILGHVLFALNAHVWEPISNKFPWNKTDYEKEALEDIKTQFPDLLIEFVPEDSTFLYALLRERNSPDFSLETIFRQFVYMQLTRNLSFVILILGIKQFLALIILGFSSNVLLYGILLLFIGRLLKRWCRTHWFFLHLYVFYASLAYGTSLEAVLINNEPKWETSALIQKRTKESIQEDTNVE